MSLLEKAKSIPVHNTNTNKRLDIPDSEKIELALAWLKEEITFTQFSGAIGRKTGNSSALYNAANWLKLAYKDGKLIISS